MENKFIDDIDDLNKKYEYNINNYENYDIICTCLTSKCDTGIKQLIAAIEKLIKNLLEYNGPNIDKAQAYLKKMNEFLDYYLYLKKKIFNDNIYYISLIQNFQGQYEIHSEIKNMKELYIKNIKTILQSRVQEYIKFDKQIINLFNIIKDLNIFFNF